MALPRGFQSSANVRGVARPKGDKIFWLPGGKSTIVTLLDHDPVQMVRHKLWLKKDKDAAGMRQTCQGANPNEHPEACPRTCKVCNAALRHRDTIGRSLYFYLSLIDEREFEFNGKSYKDMKSLLELDRKGAEIFEEKRKTYGHLIGARFKVFRSKTNQNSARYGDNWEFIGHVEPVRHFWHSPAIRAIMEAATRRGERPITHQQAVANLVTPWNYDELGAYRPEEAEAFIGYLEGAGPQDDGSAGAGPPPPPPPTSMPDYTIPAGQLPAYPAPPAPQPPLAPQAPVGYPAPPPMPPPVPDPVGATPLPYGAPPMPTVSGAVAPTGTFTGQYAPPSPPVQQPYAHQTPPYQAPPYAPQPPAPPYQAAPQQPPAYQTAGAGAGASWVPNPIPQAGGFAPPQPAPYQAPPMPPPSAQQAGPPAGPPPYRPDFGGFPPQPPGGQPGPARGLDQF